MRIALCFSGQTRDICETKYSIWRHLIKPLRNHEIYFFAHTPSNHIDPWLKSYPSVIVQEDESMLNPPPLLTDHLVATRPWHDGDSYRAFYLQVRSVAESIKLQESYARNHDFEFDWVFRLRFDTLFHGPKVEDLNLLEKDAVYIPNHDNWGGLNDRFAFGPPKLMRYYAARHEYFEEFQASGHTMAPEYFLKWALDKGSVNIRRTRMTHDLLRYGELWRAHYNESRGDTPPPTGRIERFSNRLKNKLLSQRLRDYLHAKRARFPF